MDDPLLLHGDRRLDRLAPRFWRSTTPAGDLCPPAPPECRMVGFILRPSEPRFGTSRDWHLVVSDSGNFRDVLESVQAGWCADGPLSDLGWLRWGPQRSYLEDELTPGTALTGIKA